MDPGRRDQQVSQPDEQGPSAYAEKPPRRLVLGNTLPEIEAIYAERLREWREWAPVTEAAFG